MLDEERIILMTKLAAFEQRENKKIFRINSYMKHDYIAVNVIETLFTTSIVYIMGCILFIFVRYNYLLENIQNVNLFKTAYIIAGGWIASEIVFCLISYIYHHRKHADARKRISGYVADLRKLDELYEARESR